MVSGLSGKYIITNQSFATILYTYIQLYTIREKLILCNRENYCNISRQRILKHSPGMLSVNTAAVFTMMSALCRKFLFRTLERALTNFCKQIHY